MFHQAAEALPCVSIDDEHDSDYIPPMVATHYRVADTTSVVRPGALAISLGAKRSVTHCYFENNEVWSK